MAEPRDLEVEIDVKTGIPSIDALGFVGKDCEKIQDELQAALDGDCIEREEKPEKEAQVQEVSIAQQPVRRG